MKEYKTSLFFSKKATYFGTFFTDIISVFVEERWEEKKTLGKHNSWFYRKNIMIILNHILISNHFYHNSNNIKK